MVVRERGAGGGLCLDLKFGFYPFRTLVSLEGGKFFGSRCLWRGLQIQRVDEGVGQDAAGGAGDGAAPRREDHVIGFRGHGDCAWKGSGSAAVGSMCRGAGEGERNWAGGAGCGAL